MRLAVVGAGRIGRRHVQLVRSSALSELAAIVDPYPGAAALARSAGVAWHADLEDLLRGEQPDGIIVATPNSQHLAHGLASIAARLPALIEKPIATSVADGMRLAAAAERSGVPLLIGHHRRHSPILARGQEIVRSGALGDIVAVLGTALFFKPVDYFESAPWRRMSGGGPILINMVHEIDDLRVLCGGINSVGAMSSSVARGFPVEDTVALTIRFASGALGTFLLSDTAAAPWSWEQTSGEDASYVGYPEEDCYRIIGTNGSLSVPSMRVWAFRGAPSWTEPLEVTTVSLARVDPLVRQLEHFCAVVRGDAAPLVTAKDATETLRVTLAIAQAARSGTEVATSSESPRPG